MLNSQRSRSQASTGARALYLGARGRKQVSCTDEALVVRNAEQQTLRYPLARVSRVVTSITNDWTGAALALCLREGIGITWLDAKGEALGSCYPHHRTTPRAASALEAMLETEDGLDRYQHWLRQRRMDVLVRWGAAAGSQITPDAWERTKTDWVYGGRFSEGLPTGLRGLCMAYVAGRLARHGLGDALWGPKAQAIALDSDLCSLVWGEMNLCAGALLQQQQVDASVTALFEGWMGVNGGHLAEHIHSLERCALKAWRDL